MNSSEVEQYRQLLETPTHVTVTSNQVEYSMSKVKVKKIDSKAKLPTKSNPLDAGYDLYSIVDEVIKPHTRSIIKTGISMAIPANYVGLIWPRSGLAAKQGVDVLAGVIDSGYRGEICVVLQNHGEKNVNIKSGDRIAQMLFQQIESFQLQECEDLEDSARGDAGFGSTGF